MKCETRCITFVPKRVFGAQRKTAALFPSCYFAQNALPNYKWFQMISCNKVSHAPRRLKTATNEIIQKRTKLFKKE
jgi:hypothetical protein